MVEQIKTLMKLYNITYVELGERLGRSPYTVKQRLNTPHTFHKIEEEYLNALNACIAKREEKIELLLKEIENGK